MNIQQMLQELRDERKQIEEAILALERMATGQGKRRGRPPKWMTQASAEASPTTPRRRRFSAETRAKMAAAQRKRWAAKRKREGTPKA
jgi:hypothetical protein